MGNRRDCKRGSYTTSKKRFLSTARLSLITTHTCSTFPPKDGDAGNSFTSKVGKSDDTVDPLVEKLTEQINSLTTIVKSTVDSAKRQGEELATLRKSVGESNQSTAEDLDSSAPAEVSWPMDMNEPINKDTTPVSKSFY